MDLKNLIVEYPGSEGGIRLCGFNEMGLDIHVDGSYHLVEICEAPHLKRLLTEQSQNRSYVTLPIEFLSTKRKASWL